MLLRPTAAAADVFPQLKHQLQFQISTDPLHSSSSCTSGTNSLLLLYRLKQQKACITISPASARRRARWVEEEEENNEEEEEEEYNKEIALLELYTQTCRGEALIVHAFVDDNPVEVLIFRGFSSCLNYGTAADPTKSVIPARSVMKSVDRIEGPFDPSNIHYLEKEISWDSFKSRLPDPSSVE
ncbi:hypothetical protein LINPERPRIM_LOCUS32410 [Linum perenne]